MSGWGLSAFIAGLGHGIRGIRREGSKFVRTPLHDDVRRRSGHDICPAPHDDLLAQLR